MWRPTPGWRGARCGHSSDAPVPLVAETFTESVSKRDEDEENITIMLSKEEGLRKRKEKIFCTIRYEDNDSHSLG